VGLRRNAFLVAAPQVSQYVEGFVIQFMLLILARYVIYRQSLIDHLLGVTLKHWDPAMRSSGAQSLREICQNDMSSLVPNIITTLVRIILNLVTADGLIQPT
jgi:hypothetical protein